ncbi:hypothetical protein AK812_SmicGene49105 [Symbiodinium microadriaticum]|uniref:Uncharacterized protein n=1 Tax=Symbiodinium microadriaticum TaxID=2951 RepID=A0A1Q9CMF4_SYMMI|nr:hypothetical protein AK812_SmicGene49105 [Symbiodinium microadriaticum]CAE7183016.1 unnamed protein product [Symbiodinium microadriaticum]
MTAGGHRIQYTSPVPSEGYLPLNTALVQSPFPPGLKFEPGQVSPCTGSTDSPISTGTGSSFFTASATEKLRLHKAGQCHPCVAYAFRAAGCYKGDSCSHCHFCTASQATVRRRQLQAAARQQRKKQRPADQGKEAAATARILAGEPFWL